MKAFFKYSVFLILFFPALPCAQNYTLTDGKKAGKVKFQLINNLIVVPVTVNGAELSFILDSGVGSPILFNLMDQDSISINDVSEVIIKGLGDEGAIKALKSTNNVFKIGTARNWKQTLYVVLDEELNFSPRLGIPIHGIIGYDLYRIRVVSQVQEQDAAMVADALYPAGKQDFLTGFAEIEVLALTSAVNVLLHMFVSFEQKYPYLPA